MRDLGYYDILCTLVNCGNPEDANNSVSITGYNEQAAVIGTTIFYSCPPSFVLIGPNSSICMENGKWNPDSSRIECREGIL